jgi:hypothetical protein
MTREDLAAQLGALALALFPDGMEAHDLSLEDVEAARLRTIAIFDEADAQVRHDAQQTAEDVADDIFQQALDERGGIGLD